MNDSTIVVKDEQGKDCFIARDMKDAFARALVRNWFHFLVSDGEKTRRYMFGKFFYNSKANTVYVLMIQNYKLIYQFNLEDVKDYIIVDPEFAEVIFNKETGYAFEGTAVSICNHIGWAGIGTHAHFLPKLICYAICKKADIVRYDDRYIAIGKRLENGNIKLHFGDELTPDKCLERIKAASFENISRIFNPKSILII